MKMIGLIGGISWISTADYYRMINEGVNERLGGLQFPTCVIYSFNYADIKKNNDAGDWDKTLGMIVSATKSLERAGAEGLILCANTMHLIADRIQQEIAIPLIHIATATAADISSKQLGKVGLLGTKFTMEQRFFKEKLLEKNIETLIPEEEDRQFLHDTIFDELGKGIVLPATRDRYLRIAGDLIERGAAGIILGCTEIPLLIKPADLSVPVFDTALIHAKAAIDFVLS